MLLFLVIVVPVSGTVVYGAILKTKIQYFRWHNTKAALFIVLGYLSLFPSCSPVPNPPFHRKLLAPFTTICCPAQEAPASLPSTLVASHLQC